MQPEDGTMSGDGEPIDRPREEPEKYSQQEQLRALREEGDHDHIYFDSSEAEEEKILRDQFGPPDDDGIYHERGEES